jgi:hypothetical protein
MLGSQESVRMLGSQESVRMEVPSRGHVCPRGILKPRHTRAIGKVSAIVDCLSGSKPRMLSFEAARWIS